MVDATIQEQNSFCCADCQGRVIASGGFIVCVECGQVISKNYVAPTYQMGEEYNDGHPDAAVFGSLGNRLHIVDGLGSYIGYHKDQFFRDANGHVLSGKMQKKFRRLKSVYSTRIRIGKDEAKYRALRTLNHVSKLLMLNEQVRDRTAYLYKKILAEMPKKETNNILLMAVCLLMAVREFAESAPVTLEEIAAVFEKCGHRVSVRSIVRRALELRGVTGQAPQIRKPLDYVPRVISMLMNSPKVMRKVRQRGWDPQEYETRLRDTLVDILEIIPASKRGGRNPFIFTVSAVYASDRLINAERGKSSVLTQKLTAHATEVAEYSIRDHYSMIKRFINKRKMVSVI